MVCPVSLSNLEQNCLHFPFLKTTLNCNNIMIFHIFAETTCINRKTRLTTCCTMLFLTCWKKIYDIVTLTRRVGLMIVKTCLTLTQSELGKFVA